MGRWIVFVAPLLPALSGACSNAPAEQAKPPLAVEAVQPRPVDAEASAATAGTFPVRLLYDREATISLRLGGSLSAMPVHPGDRIAAGTLIAAITPTLYAEGERRAAAEVQRLELAAQRNLTLLPAGAISEAQRDDTVSALAAARAALRAARYDRSSTAARAPFPALVLGRMREVGETVSPGEPIARIADTASPFLARAAVSPAVAATLAAGREVVVMVAGHGSVRGHILRLGSAVDPVSGTLDVDIALPRGTGLPSGLTGSVRLAGGHQRDTAGAAAVLAIPAEALVDAESSSGKAPSRGHVFVVDPQKSVAKRTAVMLRGFAGDWLQVEGLPADARVITAGAGFVRDGQTVRVTVK